MLIMKLNGGYNGLCGRYFRRALFAVFLILSGCAGERQEGAVHKIQVDIDSLAKEQVSIYDIFSKVELVSLDNEYPVGNIVYTGASNITWDGSKFYILDVRTFASEAFGQGRPRPRRVHHGRPDLLQQGSGPYRDTQPYGKDIPVHSRLIEVRLGSELYGQGTSCNA